MLINTSISKKARASFTSITLSLILAIAPAVFAAGGGGGGGFSSPSRTAPSIDPVASYQKGIAELKSGNHRAAVKAFKKVLSVNKKHAPSNFFLGVSLFNQGKYKKAKRPFTKALKYDDTLISAHGYLGVVYQKTNKLDKAAKQREILVAKQAECGECDDQAKIAQALARIDGKLSDEITQSSVGTGQKLTDGDAQYIKAVGYINQGDYRAALLSLAESSRILGPHPDVLTYQGFANRKLGNQSLALEFYQSALAIDGDHRGANEYLGEFYVETGRLDLARIQLKKLTRICQFGCEEAEELRRWIDAAS